MFHLQLRFHRVYQRGLCFILAFQGFQDLFVNRSPGDDVVDNDGSGSLPLTPQPGIRLLVKLQRPCQPEPHQGVSAVLQVQPVAG